MKFSTPIKFSGLVKFSPDNKNVAFSKGLDLLVYDLEDLQLFRNFTFLDFPNAIEWSSDSQYILVCLYKRGTIEVRSLSDSTWRCKIDEGMEGISRGMFLNDATKILLVNDFSIGIKIYSLSDLSITKISNPKNSDCVFISRSRSLFAVLLRQDEGDAIGVFQIKQDGVYKISEFIVGMKDPIEVVFTIDEINIIVRESSLYCSFKVFSLFGDCIRTITPYSNKLGIRSMEISTKYLAVGFYDECVRIYHTVTWNEIAVLEHFDYYRLTSELLVFKEQFPIENNNIDQDITEYIIQEEGEVKLNRVYPDMSKPNPAKGIGILRFSDNTNYLATHNSTTPDVIYLWRLDLMSLYALIIQLNKISHLDWGSHNSKETLAIATESKNLYLVNPYEASVCPLPIKKTDYTKISSLAWDLQGESLIANDRNVFFYCRLDEENNEESQDKEEEGQHDDQYV